MPRFQRETASDEADILCRHIRQSVWLNFRITLSFRDIEDLMAERGIDVSYETVRCRTQKFGRMFAHNLRESRTASR